MTLADEGRPPYAPPMAATPIERKRSTVLLGAGLLAGLLTGGCGGGVEGPRVLVVGWDGAGFELLDPLLAQGRLPHLADLMRRGRTAVLESTRIPISSAAWTSAMTGVGPGQTGVYGFFEPAPEGYDVQLIDSRSNQAPPLWRILSGRGVGVSVFGVPVTWPPEPVNGVMVSGMLAPHDGGFALPVAYEQDLLARGFVPDLGVWRSGSLSDAGRVRQQLAIKEAALVEQLERDDWSCFVTVFKCLDVVSHQAWNANPEGPAAQLAIELDRVLGRLLEAVGPEVDVFLVSDHGFRRYPRALDLEAFLLEGGWTVRGNEAPPAEPIGGPLAEARPRLHQARLARLDLPRCRALAGDCEGNFGSLRLNLQDREAEGLVPEAEREATLDALEAQLRALTLDGEPAVVAVWRGEELMPGPHRRALPDLVFETVPDLRVLVGDGERLVTPTPRPFPDHAFEGIAVVAGPSVKPAPSRGRWQIDDVAPTVLHLLEQPLHAEMTGSAHAEVLAIPRASVRIPRAEDPTLRTRELLEREGARSANEQRELLQALQAMGYSGELEEQ